MSNVLVLPFTRRLSGKLLFSFLYFNIRMLALFRLILCHQGQSLSKQINKIKSFVTNQDADSHVGPSTMTVSEAQ